ncbi:MAG: guanine deaminase [Bacteroidales bacterium]
MKKDQDFIREAIDLSARNLNHKEGGPFGAVVVKEGKIIGKGWNTVVRDNDPTAHAEVNAIRDACKTLNSFQLDGCTLYTSCEPCPMCLGAIYWARPEKVVFAASRKDAENAGFDDSFIYNEIPLPPEKRKIKFIQLSENEAKAVFDKWNKLDKKVHY